MSLKSFTQRNQQHRERFELNRSQLRELWRQLELQHQRQEELGWLDHLVDIVFFLVLGSILFAVLVASAVLF